MLQEFAKTWSTKYSGLQRSKCAISCVIFPPTFTQSSKLSAMFKSSLALMTRSYVLRMTVKFAYLRVDILNGYSNTSIVPVVGENGRVGEGEGEVGRRSCELSILWSDLVRELRNNKYMGKPNLLSVWM